MIIKTGAFLLAILLASCASIPQSPIQLRIDASKELNLDVTRASLPVRLKIYQLSDPTRFNEATFRELWKSDVATLGTTLLLKKEVTINPGEEQVIKLPRNEQAEYLGVVGVFRRHNDNDWKTLKRLPGQVGSLLKKVSVTAKNNQVEIR